jgi:hypothetical protein
MEPVAVQIHENFAVSAQITVEAFLYGLRARSLRFADRNGDQFLGELASRLYSSRALIPGEP